MSILDLHADELAQTAANTRYIPQPKPPASKFNAWRTTTAVPRGAAGGSAEAAGFWSDVMGAFGQAYATTEPARPMFGADLNAKETEAARQKMLKEGLDFSSETGDIFREVARSYRPDHQSAHLAESLLYDLSRFATKAVGYSVLGGPWAGAGFTAADEALAASDELKRQGVDLHTRTKAGAVQGGAAGLGVVLPIAGKTWAQTAGLVALGGPGTFVASQAITREILKDADYSKLADQYDPFDPVGLTVSTLVPAAFGVAARRARVSREAPPQPVTDAALVANQQAARDASSLARPEDLAGQAAHDDALAKAEQQLAAGEPVRVNDVAPDRITSDAIIESRLRAKLDSDPEAAAREYAALKDSDSGRILNTDTARELSPDYLSDRTRSAAVHEPASAFIKARYAELLKQEPKEGELPLVVFTAGGTGAGKTTAIQTIPEMAEAAARAQIVYDTNMNKYASAKQKIEQALAAGKDVSIMMVARDPEQALVQGALPRAERQAKEYGSGRTVPIEEHIKTHIGAVETVTRLAQEYADNPRVQVRVIDNSLGRGHATERDVAWLGQRRYNDIEQRVTAALERERAEGRISDATYQGFAGRPWQNPGAAEGSGRVPQDVRPDVREGPEPGRTEGQVAETASHQARLDELTLENPDMLVQMDGMEKPQRLADFLATVKQVADEMKQDAPDFEVAANCLLSNGL
jgi:hypothetical protein